MDKLKMNYGIRGNFNWESYRSNVKYLNLINLNILVVHHSSYIPDCSSDGAGRRMLALRGCRINMRFMTWSFATAHDVICIILLHLSLISQLITKWT
ncbi:hypothetical protein IU46_018595 [Pantoea agglomerans]|nr:hypothetical protein IU46_018595 [Pantoea agglomerans]